MDKHAGSIVKGATLMAAVTALIAMSSPFANAAEAAAGASSPQVVTTVHCAPPATPPARTDTTFHPNYDHALSVGQMSAAWQAELDRLFPQPVTGGG